MAKRPRWVFSSTMGLVIYRAQILNTMQCIRSLEGKELALDECTIKCTRCETDTPESELIEVHAWWLCGNCYDEI